MPLWKQLRDSATGDGDNWEERAVALAIKLDQAAEDLRDLAEAIRKESLDGEDTDERPRPQS